MDSTKRKIVLETGKDQSFQDMLKLELPYDQTSLDPNDEHNARTEGQVGDDDELVKHMSNVPAFLQKARNQNNVQEKALNFGVLDWKRLEKWKYNEPMPRKCPKKSASIIRSGYAVSGPPRMSPNLRSQQPPCLSSSSLSQGKQALPHSLSVSSPQSNPSSPHLNLLRMERRDTSHEQESYFGGVKQPGRRLLTFSQEDQASRGCSITWRQNFHQKVEGRDGSSEKNVIIKRNEMKRVVQMDRLALNEGRHGFSPSSNDVIGVHVRKNGNGLDDWEEPQNLVTSRASDLFDCRNSFNNPNLVSLRQSQIIKPSFSAEVQKESDTNISKQLAVKTSHPSPTQVNAGIAKLSKSDSFKESSYVPHFGYSYSTVRSGPMMPFSNIKKDKTTSSSNSGRSSPLRRLLDPLLKNKGSQSIGIAASPNGTLHSMTSITIHTKVPSQDTKSLGISSQGLLQLTLKNGLPFFKLMVDNSSSGVLAAVGKRLPSFEKSDHSMIYAFYSIHEIKKQSTTWMHKTKSKSCGLGFTVVGQMKISGSSNQSAVRECVLYGVDKEQMDKQGPEFFSDEELVAIVLQTSRQRLKDGVSADGEMSPQDRCSPHNVARAMSDKGEDEQSFNNAVVILPGGVHGIPSKGVHSSLISRWRSGGSCDCGGWDVGCKLQVLTNQCNRGGKVSEASSTPSSSLDSVNLFVQGGERTGKPNLNLEAMGNGFHSLELDSSMPLLEAFATCVAFVTCHRFPDFLETNIPEPIADKKNLSTTTARTSPAKYATLLPQSPVGRI